MRTTEVNGYTLCLIESMDELYKEAKERLAKSVYVGMDTETSGLDYNKDVVAGICISFGKNLSEQEYRGYYLPINHINYPNNLPKDEVCKFTQYLLNKYSTVFWNRPFDLFQFENLGISIPFIGGMNDAQCMEFLVACDRFPSLKPTCRKYFPNWNMMDYSDNESMNFCETDPRKSFRYAAFDPVATVKVAVEIWNRYSYIRKIYPLDNASSEAVRRFSKSLIYFNKEYVHELLIQKTEELKDITNQIYELAGYQFNIKSNREKADALSRFVTLTEKTKAGSFMVNEEILSKIDHPLAKLFLKHVEVAKYISTYLKKMDNFPNPFRCNYSCVNTATGRLSSGGSENNSYFAPFNIQNVPKVEEKKFVHLDPVYGQIVTDEEEGSIGKIKCKAGLRGAFVPPEGYLWCAFDYSAEEMCSVEGTLVTTPNGDVPIEDLKVGDLVTTPYGDYPVTATAITKLKKVCTIELTSGEVYHCSPEQRIMVVRDGERHWYEFSELKETDWVVTNYWMKRVHDYVSDRGNIKKLHMSDEKVPMHDITVDIVNCFYADGILAHNCLMANFSGEPNLIEPLKHGLDIHNYIAKNMFGFEDPSHRTQVKILNFACLARDSYVLTQRGYVRPEYIHEDTDRLFTSKGVLQNFHIKKFVNDTTYVTYANGITEQYKYDHKVKVLNSTTGEESWMEVRNLKVGDCVVLCANTNDFQGYEFEKCDKYDSKEFLRLCGCYVRSGHWYFDGEVVINLTDEDYRAVRPCLDDWFSSHRVAYSNNGYVLSLSSSEVGQLYKKFGCQDDLMIDDSVFQLPHDRLQSFVEGFLEDGCIVGLYTKKMVSQLRRLLLYCGYIVEGVQSGHRIKCTKVADEDRVVTWVQSVEYGGQDFCYAIECDGEPEYVSAVVSHNCNYGANEYTIANKLGCSVEAAKKLLDQYNATLSKLTAWKKYMQNLAKRTGMVFTFFGRPRVLKQYYNSADMSKRAFGDRAAINTPVQGCVPLCSYLELDDRVVSMSSNLGKRLVFCDRYAVPTHRGHNEPLLVRFGRKDWMICDINHKFISGSLDAPTVKTLRDGESFKCLFSKLHKRYWGDFSQACKILKFAFTHSSSECVSLIRIRMRRDEEILKGDISLCGSFLRLAFSRRRFTLDFKDMCRIKSLGTVYGYNVCCNKKGNKFHIEFRRKKSAWLRMIKSVLPSVYDEKAMENVPQTVEVGSCTVVSPDSFQMYPSFGIWNKNTGGDIIRRDFVKLYKYLDTHPEFRENVIPVLSVHDELDFYIKPDYLYKASQIIQELMKVDEPEFVVPVTTSCAVGTTWGLCADVERINPDNTIVYIDLDKKE